MDGDQSYGNMVMLSHADGNTTLYAHLSEISVSPGDAVEKGSEIGKSGTTGNSTGPHLHLEVRTADGRVDPMKFLQGSQDPLSPEESEAVSGESTPETQRTTAGRKPLRQNMRLFRKTASPAGRASDKRNVDFHRRHQCVHRRAGHRYLRRNQDPHEQNDGISGRQPGYRLLHRARRRGELSEDYENVEGFDSGSQHFASGRRCADFWIQG